MKLSPISLAVLPLLTMFSAQAAVYQIVELDTKENDPAILLANNVPIAEGEIDFDNDSIMFKVNNMLNREHSMPITSNALYALN